MINTGDDNFANTVMLSKSMGAPIRKPSLWEVFGSWEHGCKGAWQSAPGTWGWGLGVRRDALPTGALAMGTVGVAGSYT